MERSQKEKTVAELIEYFSNSDALYLTDFKGLNVEAIQVLRKKISEAGGQYRVVKNTLLRLAAKDTDVIKLEQYFVGNNALGTTSEDPAVLAKALVEFAKENNKLIIKGGILSGEVLTPEQVEQIASLPSREILLGIVLGAMNAVPTNLVRALNALASNFVYALAAIRDQKEEAGN